MVPSHSGKNLAVRSSSDVRAPVRRSHRPAALVLLFGLGVSALLALLAHTANDRNNARLLELQTKEAASVLGSVLPVIETPLASAAALADATDGDAAQFRQFISPLVGRGSGRLFLSAALWRVSGPRPVEVAVVGERPLIDRSPRSRDALFERALPIPTLAVSSVLGSTDARLGYAYAVAPTSGYVVYSESGLPPHRIAPIQKSSAFADLSYALYLGAARPANLLEESTTTWPHGAPVAMTTTPFGNSSFTLVAATAAQLGGPISSNLWWWIALLGTATTAGATVVAERLSSGRRAAIEVAAENGRLYAAQRTVAETLQHALLPEAFPESPTIEIRARYVAGVADLDVGGDWYEVRRLDADRYLLVVGDVSGRGLRAATIMASVRYSIAAYALQGDEPGEILTKLSHVINISVDRHFATVLCGVIDTKRNEVTFANAGHLPLLLSSGGRVQYLDGPVGPPVGVPSPDRYVMTTVAIPKGSTLIGFTDGLVERRVEHLDLGLDRLATAVAESPADRALDDLLGDLVSTLTPSGPVDDIALIGVRWRP